MKLQKKLNDLESRIYARLGQGGQISLKRFKASLKTHQEAIAGGQEPVTALDFAAVVLMERPAEYDDTRRGQLIREHAVSTPAFQECLQLIVQNVRNSLMVQVEYDGSLNDVIVTEVQR